MICPLVFCPFPISFLPFESSSLLPTLHPFFSNQDQLIRLPVIRFSSECLHPEPECELQNLPSGILPPSPVFFIRFCLCPDAIYCPPQNWKQQKVQKKIPCPDTSQTFNLLSSDVSSMPNSTRPWLPNLLTDVLDHRITIFLIVV